MKKLLSVCLTLALCLGLAVPALAIEQEDQRIDMNGTSYQALLQALLSEGEDKPVTVRLDTDVDLHAFSIVLGSSDYGGLFNDQTVTIASHDVTIDLNGHTLTGEEGYPIFEIQDGYKLTVTDSAQVKSGKLISQSDEVADVKDGGVFNLEVPAFTAVDQRIIVNGAAYDRLLRALLSETEDKPVTATLETDVELTFAVVIGSSDYGGMFDGQVQTVVSHDVTVDLNGHTLTGDVGCSIFEVQSGYKLTVIDSSADKTGKLVSQGDKLADVKDGGEFNYDAAGTEKPDDAKPEQPDDAKPEPPVAAGASEWAKELVKEAEDAKLVPEDMKNSYQSNITRLDFCRLAVTLVEQASGKTAAELAAEKGVTLGDPFTDTHHDAAIAAAALGIISGRGDGIFDPDASITRQEAAVMLMKAGQVLGTEAPSAGSIPVWNDADGIQSWAGEAVTYVASLGVMGSTDTAQAVFSPTGQYTREMSYITSLRLFQAAEK